MFSKLKPSYKHLQRCSQSFGNGHFCLAKLMSTRSVELQSLSWSCDALHSLNQDQIDFRHNVRSFAEKELRNDFDQKVVL